MYVSEIGAMTNSQQKKSSQKQKLLLALLSAAAALGTINISLNVQGFTLCLSQRYFKTQIFQVSENDYYIYYTRL